MADGPPQSDPAPPGLLTSGPIEVGQGHSLYAETYGTPDGVPAVFLHGGPGGGFHSGHRSLFDPERCRTVFFDQRGAGRSLPKRRLEANTTDHLIADMELLREHFGIAKWVVVGGSWGATLALAYAERHPSRVLGIVLRATFLGTRTELDAAFRISLPMFYPSLNKDFLDFLPEAERASPLEGYWSRILGPDPEIARTFAWAWHDTERILSELAPGTLRLDLARIADPARGLPTSPFLEAHYFRHQSFLADAPLLQNATALAGIPGILVQGRYDLLCPPATSHDLVQVWPDAEIRLVRDAGHSLSDGGTFAALKTAIAEMVDRTGGRPA